MNKTLPESTKVFLRPLPENRSDQGVEENINVLRDLYGDRYVESLIWTQGDAKQVLDILGIDKDTTLYAFYLNAIELPDCFRSEDIYGLNEVLENYRKPFWGVKYKNIENKYLQLSSIEGEYSYFYDRGNDSVYGVDWGDMESFIAGKLEPLFITFYDFLQWYYSDVDE